MSSLKFIGEFSDSDEASMSFTGIFTSSYDVYQVVIDRIDFASADLFGRFIKSDDSVDSSSNYDDAVALLRSYSGGFAANQTAGGTSFGSSGFHDEATIGADSGGATVMYVFNPVASKNTMAIWENAGINAGGTPARKGGAILKTTDSITGLNFTGTSSATIRFLRFRVYGLEKP